MRLVPAGDFTMGSDSDSDLRNAPHSVYLDAFYMDKYEVTNAHYADCVMAGMCNLPHETKSDFRASYYGNPEFDSFPVMYVDWYMARTYCEEWRGAHLYLARLLIAVFSSLFFSTQSRYTCAALRSLQCR